MQSKFWIGLVVGPVGDWESLFNQEIVIFVGDDSMVKQNDDATINTIIIFIF